MKRKFFHCPADTLEEFRTAAEAAAKMGVTHVYVSELPKSRWQWEMDLSDPYPNWGMMHSAIFKVVPTPELAQWVPQDYVEKNWQLLQQRCAILKELGLKAAFKGCEPGWLPEGVYAAHPDWRGARCDHPRRSRRPYFSPCIDNPEVLAMYRSAVHKLCAATGIEVFTFLSNDSGGGICWSQGLYPGVNGPHDCRNIPFARRIVKFMDTLQQGAADAGCFAQVSIGGSIPEFEIAAAVPSLKPGQSLGGLDATGSRAVMHLGSQDEWYFNCMHPVLGIPPVVRFTENAVAAYCNPEAERSINIFSAANGIMLRLAAFLEQHQPNTRYRAELCLHDFAAAEAGEAHAEALLEVWHLVDTYYNAVKPIDEGGPLLLLGALNQRWLIRPLVPQPLELEEDVRREYRPFQFQANSEREAADLMDLQGARLVSGHSAAFITRNMLQIGRQALQKANAILKAIVSDFPENTREEYTFLCHQLLVLDSVARTAQNCIAYQEVLDRSDFSQPPVETPIWHVPSDQRLLILQEVARDEIDNTHTLSGLLKQYPLARQLAVAPSEEEEDVFLLSPRVPEQLEKKHRVMVRELQTLYRLYTRFN